VTKPELTEVATRNGKEAPDEAWREHPPIPHAVQAGQATAPDGHIWVGLMFSTPGVTMTLQMDPRKAKLLGQSLVDMGTADQQMLPPKSQLIYPPQ